MKKKITILLLVLFATANIYSQNYNINFSAIGAATTVDSVKVDNLTKNISLKMSGTDILHLGDVGVNEFEVNNNNLKVYPNPMYGKAELIFYADKEGDVLVNVFDIRGLEILKYAHNAEKGVHKFQLNGLKQGMYFVNVRSESYSYSLKLISQNTNQSNLATISYLGFENAEKEIVKLKNTYNTVNMPYTDDDLLLFRGESGIYANIVTDVPASNKTITFNFTACIDGDSNNYATVDIGNQIWMAENLRTTRYKNGIVIPNVIDNSAWAALSTDARCYYNNDSAMYSNTYGILYNWYSVNTENICPDDWHVPAISEWTILENYLGGDTLAGGKLKETGIINWLSPNLGASNKSGFTALPGGCRIYNGNYIISGSNSFFWSSTEIETNNAWYIGLEYGNSFLKIYNLNNNNGFSVRCIKDIGTQIGIPAINTKTATLITSSNATSGGNIISDGGDSVTVRGVCWSASPNPTVLNNKTIDGSGIGSFASNISGLAPNTIYYVRAYATNSAGTAYGNEVSFTTLPQIYPVYDIDSNGYDTVHIGTQVWMKQNLRNTRYKDGSSIAYPGSNNNAWNNNHSGSYAWYNNDSATYAATYGALYNANAAISEKLCPAGWHVPSETEWSDLRDYLGGESIAGGKLKATGTISNGDGLWQSPNTGASNISGFSAIPAGMRGNNYYDGIGISSSYWSNTKDDWHLGFYKHWTVHLGYNSSVMSIYSSYDESGLSVRCLKGDRATVSTDTILGVTYNSAIIGGSIISDGGVSITAKGVCWSTSPNPKLPLCAKSTDSTVAGSYITNLNYLAANTTYYVRAYATNGIGTFYGNELIFTTLPHIYPVYDNDSNGYDTVQIGTQIWLKQNLITSRYNNGNTIPNLNNTGDWFNTTTGARCYYDNDSIKYSKTFGALYNWYSVNTSILCPVGWYVPTDAEWTTLANYLGGENIAGAKLKSTSLWYNTYSSTNQTYETYETGFSAFSGGHRENYYTSFYGIGEQGNWWSTTEYDSNNAWYRNMNSYSTHVSKDNLNKNLGYSVRCIKGDLATITTDTISNVTFNSAKSGGNIINAGGLSVTARGVCWSTSPNPTILNNKTTDSVGIGIYTSNVLGLIPNTTYYVRAYATNSAGTAYGNEISFTTLQHIYPVYDIDSNGYDTVHIGTQVWMKQNLKVGRYRNGITIPIVLHNFGDGSNIGERCYYDYDSLNNSSVYGAFYNWYAINTNNLCPIGWHVPSDIEWKILTTFLGGDSIAGGKLKATTLWNSPNTGATNETGFTALSGGSIFEGSSDGNLGLRGFWWSSTEYNSYINNVWIISMNSYSSNLNMGNGYMRNGFSVRCLIGDSAIQINLPTISTDSITTITANRATSGGNISSDGGFPILNRGVCWSTNPNPTIDLDTKTLDGNGLGGFTSNLFGLTDAPYYLRAYATNIAGTAYGNEISFITPANSYKVYDIDSNAYDTVNIGTQIWLKQNLKTSRYNDGSTIPNITDNAAWLGLSTGARCYYNNDSVIYAATYGALYNWHTVNTGNLCPVGWHVPTDNEWTVLENYLGGSTIAGNKLKEAGTSHWNYSINGTNNETGFTALPGGHRNIYYNYLYKGEGGYWWSSSATNIDYAWLRSMFWHFNGVNTLSYDKNFGYSVRCLKN